MSAHKPMAMEQTVYVSFAKAMSKDYEVVQIRDHALCVLCKHAFEQTLFVIME